MINIITPAYILKLGFKICQINIRIQKIDNSIFKIVELDLISFQVKNILKKVKFFKKTF